MAGSINKVILVGNLGKDPETRSFQNGGKVVKFPLATSETWKDKATGERKDKTEWHNVVIYNERLGEVAERFLKKGAKIYLEGQIESRKYTDSSGQERYITEVVLRQFRGELQMLDSRGAGGSGAGMGDEGGGYEGGGSAPAPARAGAGGGKKGNLDDDIPF
jgi:single-strand DNA-binding protein